VRMWRSERKLFLFLPSFPVIGSRGSTWYSFVSGSSIWVAGKINRVEISYNVLDRYFLERESTDRNKNLQTAPACPYYNIRNRIFPHTIHEGGKFHQDVRWVNLWYISTEFPVSLLWRARKITFWKRLQHYCINYSNLPVNTGWSKNLCAPDNYSTKKAKIF
jgi:hypothetical protein